MSELNPREISSGLPATISEVVSAGVSEGKRVQIADALPFVARAWWLRDLQENSELISSFDSTVTAPIWSSYSDPICDLAGLDYAYDLEES